MKQQAVGMAAAMAAFCIFGVKMVFTKDLTNSGVFSPLALVSFRLVGAAALFFLFSAIKGPEKIQKNDWLMLVLASVVQVIIAQVTSIYATVYTTPFDASMIATLKPVFTLILAVIFLKTKIKFRYIIGIALGILGVYLLVRGSNSTGFAGTSPLGIFLAMMNSLCSATYLVLFRTLILKYKPETLMKWMFLFGSVAIVPFTVPELIAVDYSSIGRLIWIELAFVVVVSTFLTYYLIATGQKYLQPLTYSVFSYFQPLVAAVLGIMLGMDVFSWGKVFAALLMITAVALVSNQDKKTVKQ